MLGEPIKDSGFDMSNANNICNADRAQFEISVRGPKDKGTVFFWATNREKGWFIDRLELEANQHPNKRFLIKKQNDYSMEAPLERNHTELPEGVPHYERQTYPKPQPLHQAEESSAFVHTADGGRMR